MKIQINTDKNVAGNAEVVASLTTLISEELSRFKHQITRLEVDLSDEDGNKKSGLANMRCMLQARLENLKPIAVIDQSETREEAIKGALKKLKTTIDTSLGRMKDY